MARGHLWGMNTVQNTHTTWQLSAVRRGLPHTRRLERSAGNHEAASDTWQR